MEDKGVWRTISGRRVFIREGQSISNAMKASGKFKGKLSQTKSLKKKNNFDKKESDRIYEKYKAWGKNPKDWENFAPTKEEGKYAYRRWWNAKSQELIKEKGKFVDPVKDLEEKQFSNGRTEKTYEIKNNYESRYGFKNVGEVKSERTMWGIGSEGTVEPTTDAVQEYLDKHFSNYGNSAKKQVVERIARDMSGRGYKANITEDGIHISNTDSSIVIGIGKNKEGNWKAKYSKSNGTKSRSGMKGTLDKYF